MWCEHCQKDVDSIRSKTGQRMRCAECDREFQLETAEQLGKTAGMPVAECDWDDWQVEEDLREARHIVELHSQNATQLSRITAGFRSRMTPAGEPPMAIPLPPSAYAKETRLANSTVENATKNVAIENVSQHAPGYADYPTANQIAANYGWAPFIFAACGLVGGFVAMHVAQRWPQYFAMVLFMELGVGAMFAAILGKRRLMATGQIPGGLHLH